MSVLTDLLEAKIAENLAIEADNNTCRHINRTWVARFKTTLATVGGDLKKLRIKGCGVCVLNGTESPKEGFLDIRDNCGNATFRIVIVPNAKTKEAVFEVVSYPTTGKLVHDRYLSSLYFEGMENEMIERLLALVISKCDADCLAPYLDTLPKKVVSLLECADCGSTDKFYAVLSEFSDVMVDGSNLDVLNDGDPIDSDLTSFVCCKCKSAQVIRR